MRRWLPFAAALVVMAGAGVWALRDGGPGETPVMRGADDGATVRVDDTRVTWSAVPGAERYVVELLAADGRPVRRDTVGTTTWPLPIAPGDSLDGALPTHVLVVALLANGRIGETRLASLGGR